MQCMMVCKVCGDMLMLGFRVAVGRDEDQKCQNERHHPKIQIEPVPIPQRNFFGSLPTLYVDFCHMK